MTTPSTYKPDINPQIDPEIRVLIKSLNKQGLETSLSCSGHMVTGYKPSVKLQNLHEDARIGNKWGTPKMSKCYTVINKGYVVFPKKSFNGHLAKKIMTEYNLKGLNGYLIHKGTDIVVVFDAIGHKGDIGEGGISAAFKI